MASRNIPFLAMVRKADPDFYKDRRREPEYEFTKRTFTADRSKRGAYAEPDEGFVTDQGHLIGTDPDIIGPQ